MPPGTARQVPCGRAAGAGIHGPQVARTACQTARPCERALTPRGVKLPAWAVGQLDLGVARFGELVGVIEREVHAAGFLAAAGALDDEVRHEREVAKLDQVTRDLEVDVVLADLVAEDLDATAGAL